MTFTTTQDIARAAAPTSSLMETPAHLEALITKDLKPFGWRKARDQVARLEKIAQENAKREKSRLHMLRELKRREKLEQIKERYQFSSSIAKDEIPVDDPPSNDAPEYFKSPFRMARLMTIFCELAGVTQMWIESPDRHRAISLKRQILMWILYRNLKKSYLAIGRKIGGRDHSTVLHGCKKINGNPDLLLLAEEFEQSVLTKERELYGSETAANLNEI